MGNWKGIMRVVEVVHRDRAGGVLRVERDILNTIHALGEEFVLKALFAGGGVPPEYYIGLDSRASISVSDAIAGLIGSEPVANGYERQAVASDGFAIVADSTTARKANGPTVLFTASGGSWGPVRNIFLCTGLGYGSDTVLVSSAALGQNIVVSDGETVSMRMAMSLSGC